LNSPRKTPEKRGLHGRRQGRRVQAGSVEHQFSGKIPMDLGDIGKKGWNFRHF
jgi:hypothetical protein